MSDKWAPHPIEEPTSCLKCERPTRSHLLYGRWGESGQLKVASESDWTLLLAVCHTCYTEYTAEEIIETSSLDDEAVEGIAPDFDEWTTGMRTLDVIGEPDRMAMGRSTIQELAYGLKTGDAVLINGDGPWVVPPGPDEEVKAEKDFEVIAEVLSDNIRNDVVVGFIGRDPSRSRSEIYFKYQHGDEGGFQTKPITELGVYSW